MVQDGGGKSYSSGPRLNGKKLINISVFVYYLPSQRQPLCCRWSRGCFGLRPAPGNTQEMSQSRLPDKRLLLASVCMNMLY